MIILYTRISTFVLLLYRMDFEPHIAFVSTICQRYLSSDADVEDAVQDTFVQAASSFGRFRHREGASFRAWLAKIAVTVSVRILRKKGKLSAMEALGNEPSDQDPAPDYLSVPPDALHAMIRSLPDGCRAVVNLHAFEGKTHKEISALLGISEGTSASQYHHAKMLLAKMITDYLWRTER